MEGVSERYTGYNSGRGDDTMGDGGARPNPSTVPA